MLHFHSLQGPGIKEYKFKQSMSGPPDDPGRCQALCLMWLAEQIQFNRKKASWAPTFLPDPDFGGSVHAKNSYNYRLAMYFDPSGLGRSSMASQLRLMPGGSVDGGQVALQFDQIPYDRALSLLVERIRNNTGALVLIDLERLPVIEGHAIAVFKDRGNVVRFFDPNCGVYIMTYPRQFIKAWIHCYEADGFELAPLNSEDGPFIVYQ